MTEFAYASSPAVRRWNRLFGVDGDTSSVIVDDRDLVATFGRWTLRTPLTNVAAAQTSGPYRTWRVAGPPRLGLTDRSLTFATNAERGLCVTFHEPVPALLPSSILRHPHLTVTVAQPEALARALGIADPLEHVDTQHGSFLGTLQALGRWVTRRRSVTLTKVDAPDPISVPDDVPTPAADAQVIESGVGPWFNRRYRVELSDATMDAAALMAEIAADPNLIAVTAMAPFVKNGGEPSEMKVGDRYTVETAGPWSGPVEVVAVGPCSFRLATLDGHMESGLIEMRASDEQPLLVFEIESWARSSDRSFDVLYDKIGVARAIQSEMWVSACESVAGIAGGEQVGPVDVVEARAVDGPG